MFHRVFLSWFKNFLLGVGCSLLAAGVIGFATPGTNPFPLVFTLVVGFVLAVLSLVIVAIELIPSTSEGE